MVMVGLEPVKLDLPVVVYTINFDAALQRKAMKKASYYVSAKLLCNLSSTLRLVNCYLLYYCIHRCRYIHHDTCHVE